MFEAAERRIVIPCVWLTTLHIFVICADFVSPYDPADQRRDSPFMRGSAIHVFDRPAVFPMFFVCRMVPVGASANGLEVSQVQQYMEDCTERFRVRWFVKRSAQYPNARESLRLFGVDEPGSIHLLGTDQYGRDQFSRFLHGGRLSLLLGLLACALAISVGTIAGSIAGFYGGFTDGAVMWASEVFLSLPWLFFLFGLRAFLPLDMEPVTAFLTIVIAIGMVGWARPARLVRNVVLSAREREYVLVARGFGASDLYILRTHILPATLNVALTQAALLVPRYILGEITLTFFGLGLNEPAASWGQMFAMLLQYFSIVPISAWMYVPGICLVITCFSYLTLADFVRSRFAER